MGLFNQNEYRLWGWSRTWVLGKPITVYKHKLDSKQRNRPVGLAERCLPMGVGRQRR